MVEEKVKSIIDSLSHTESNNFSEAICLSLAQAIKADFVFIAKLNPAHTHATTFALAADNKIVDNFTYALKATPCENVSGGSVCTHVSDTQQAYPDDQLLIDMDIAGYVGIPLKNAQGETHAILVALYHQPIQEVQEVTSLFLLFSGLITKELEKQELLNELKTRNEVIEESKEAIIVCDKDNRIISVNKAFTKITGYSFKDVKGENPSILSAKRQSKSFYQSMWQDLKAKGAWSGELWNKKKSGEEFPEWLSINTICDENNEVSHYVAFFFDISNQKKAEEKIYRQANFDLLTGVANRFLFLEQLNQLLETIEQQSSQTALLFLDLDLFKEINDIYGHDFGDILLVKIAERLKSLIKPSDFIARITGDGFAILMHDVSDQEFISDLVTRMLFEFAKPFYIEEVFIHCTLSIGIVPALESGEEAGVLMKKAEHAMYHAKDTGRNSFSYFTEDMQKTARHRMTLKNQLGDALRNRELTIVCQPILSLEHQRVEKFEVLVRWNNQGQWISPAEFIPLAEEFSMIKELGEFVLSEACSQLKKLKDQGFDDLVFNVNRSVFEIPLNKSENDHWLVLINMYGLHPSDICFELTESALAPDKRNNERLFNQLREAGCAIALDDFGTGYSSLSYIRRFPLDYIKIDKSFIADMSVSEEDNILVSTIIAMSKALGKQVVAEGVETQEQLELLMNMGCDYVQGYYLSKPLPVDEVADFIHSYQYPLMTQS